MSPNRVFALYVVGFVCLTIAVGEILRVMEADVAVRVLIGVAIGFGCARWFHPRFVAYCKDWRS